jgi:hypothetical protein
MYLEYRKGHIGRETTKGIVKGRYGTIKTHLEHWLDYIGRDVKLKELERLDCIDYSVEREKPNSKRPISLATIVNEQSTINGMMKWLHSRGETYIPAFEFETISKKNQTEEDVKRSSFTDQEVRDITVLIPNYIQEAKKDMANLANRAKVLAGYYLLVASISGLRTGEQKQLKWKDIRFEQIKKNKIDKDNANRQSALLSKFKHTYSSNPLAQTEIKYKKKKTNAHRSRIRLHHKDNRNQDHPQKRKQTKRTPKERTNMQRKETIPPTPTQGERNQDTPQRTK